MAYWRSSCKRKGRGHIGAWYALIPWKETSLLKIFSRTRRFCCKFIARNSENSYLSILKSCVIINPLEMKIKFTKGVCAMQQKNRENHNRIEKLMIKGMALLMCGR